MTVSIRDLSYEVVPDTAFHPFCIKTAKKRMISQFKKQIEYTSQNFQDTLDSILSTMLDNPKVAGVWATIIEFRSMPIFVIRNLAHTNTTLPYRRILLVKLDSSMYPAAHAFTEQITM